MGIRWRLALFGMVVTSAALLVFALLLNSILVPGVEEDQDKLLSDIAESAVASVEATGAENTYVGFPPVVIDPTVSDQPFVVVVDETGAPLYSEASIGGEAPRLPAAMVIEALETGSSQATSNEIRLQARSFDHPDAGKGVVAAGQSTRVAQEQLAGFRAFLFVFAVITVAAAAVVSWLVSGRALRPLNTLANTADEISRTGDLSRRLPAVRTNDEVGALTQSFNGMLDRLEEAQAQLERTVEAQRRFVADASHELRTPLTTIRSNSGFLRDHPDADRADREGALADIGAEAERMTRLVNDLLLLAKSDAGVKWGREPVALAEVIEDVVRRSRGFSDRVVLHLDGSVVVLGDADALTQLAVILIDNAGSHAKGPIEVTVGHDDSNAFLIVADEGQGVAAGEEEAIFERFHRADGTRHQGGSGLGLAIAKSIAEGHDGSISARNSDGGGAVFEVRLPRT